MISVDPGEEVVELRVRDFYASPLKRIFEIDLGEFIVMASVHTFEKRPELLFGMFDECGEIYNSRWLVDGDDGY